MTQRHVAVIGGGFSGTLLAIHLLDRGARVTLIERADRISLGVAYSTRHSDHLLNVRASGMSAFPDSPDHFADWLVANGGGDEGDFAQRRSYGRYLQGLLDTAHAQAGERLQIMQAEALDVQSRSAGEIVWLAGKERIEADAVVLAIGNLPPEIPRALAEAGLSEGVYRADPWAADLAVDLDPDDVVLLIGTGLTAIDAALLLDSAGFAGRIFALSRRGLLPRAHADVPSSGAELESAPELRCAKLLRFVRSRAEQSDWRSAVDMLRPVTQTIWSDASPAERRRFLRHLRPWWDVHRHRIAPSIDARLKTMIADGRLVIAPGRISSVAAETDAARLRWRARGELAERTMLVRRIVNCTGPQADIARAGEPLLDNLLRAGRIRPDLCSIGMDVDLESRTLSAAGCSDTLRGVGPLTKGMFWEIVAVPDIRDQVRTVAEALCPC